MVLIPFLILGGLFFLFFKLVLYSRSRIYSLEKVPFSQYTLVLGAGIDKNGLPTDILADRVKAAVNLINNKKTEVLILSGASTSQNFCEPESMKTMAEFLGVKASSLILDNLGTSTYDSCLNSSKIIGASQITIVTQMFHLPRAIWLAEAMGFKVIGTPANFYKFSTYKVTYWYLREIFALPINFMKLMTFRFKD
ncbi:MAG: YdcF family protein [Anaerolineaceae bacterium]|jgi:vancomycin permeability regulator SanA|nr:YdcF family protein [Anaerolineaceae bacterium]